MRYAIWSLGALALLAGPVCWAAGGHHAVDDAAILDENQCEAEGWWSRTRGDGQSLHAGAACRVGAVELGGAVDRAKPDGEPATQGGLQVKWASALTPSLNFGASLSAGWQANAHPSHQGTTAALLLTWVPAENLALHANLGKDFLRGGDRANRSGAAIEWTAAAGWTLVAERYVQERLHFVRAGVRWAFSQDWSVDASHAHRLGGTSGSNWTVGFTRQFGR